MKTIVRMTMPAVAALLLSAGNAAAHCDSMDGPVVKAAQRALESGDVAHGLIWVKPAQEMEIRAAFAKTQAVRKLGKDAAEMADRWFFETLVRIHREGEGEPFTGLKPAGFYKDPAFAAADRALETRSLEALKPIVTQMLGKLEELHKAVVAARDFDPRDLAAGRKYVELYAEYMHYVESLAH